MSRHCSVCWDEEHTKPNCRFANDPAALVIEEIVRIHQDGNKKMPQELPPKLLKRYKHHVLGENTPRNFEELASRLVPYRRFFFTEKKWDALVVKDVKNRAKQVALLIVQQQRSTRRSRAVDFETMDGHGRFIVELGWWLQEFNADLTKVNVYLVDINSDVVAYHRQVFPGLHHRERSIITKPLKFYQKLVYMNFCGITEAFKDVRRMVTAWFDGITKMGKDEWKELPIVAFTVVVSMSVARSAAHLDYEGKWLKWGMANNVNVFPQTDRQSFLTVYLTMLTMLPHRPRAR